MGCEISWAMEFETVWAGTIDKRKPLHISWTALISKPNCFYLQQVVPKISKKKKLQPSLGPSLSNHWFLSSPFNIQKPGQGCVILDITCVGAHRRCCRRPHSQSTSSGTQVERVVNHWWLEQFHGEIILFGGSSPGDESTGNKNCDCGKLGQLAPILPHFLWRVK